MTKAEKRKNTPIYKGLLAYFPNAIREVAKNSFNANAQHNGDSPIHWDKSKSKDELDSMLRHLTDYASGKTHDDDGTLHLAKVAWRALAALERHLTGQLDVYEPTTKTDDFFNEYVADKKLNAVITHNKSFISNVAPVIFSSKTFSNIDNVLFKGVKTPMPPRVDIMFRDGYQPLFTIKDVEAGYHKEHLGRFVVLYGGLQLSKNMSNLKNVIIHKYKS